MKSVALVILLLSSVIIAVLLQFAKTQNENNEKERIRKGFAGIEHVMRPYSNINYNESNVKESITRTLTRYFLAPGIASFRSVPCDTLLSIININDSDSTIHKLTDGRRLLWENKDDQNHYILSCK